MIWEADWLWSSLSLPLNHMTVETANLCLRSMLCTICVHVNKWDFSDLVYIKTNDGNKTGRHSSAGGIKGDVFQMIWGRPNSVQLVAFTNYADFCVHVRKAGLYLFEFIIWWNLDCHRKGSVLISPEIGIQFHSNTLFIHHFPTWTPSSSKWISYLLVVIWVSSEVSGVSVNTWVVCRRQCILG